MSAGDSGKWTSSRPTVARLILLFVQAARNYLKEPAEEKFDNSAKYPNFAFPIAITPEWRNW